MRHSWFMLVLCVLCALLSAPKATPAGTGPAGFTVTRGWLDMRDGVRLAATYWLPTPRARGERVPVVFEMLPYRKDDDFALRDYPQYAYLARHGIAGVRIDVRGTGSSYGALPDREYSDQELTDLQTVISRLAAMPWSNGKVGMQGISWSAFNAIMTAMRRPPHLAGILVAHGSEDLYGNDVHYPDGILHLDALVSEIELQNAVPRSPDYVVDARYFADRFDRPPWTFGYLRHQRDGGFWETGRSLQTDYGSVAVPVYAIAGLLDGYRDYAIAMLDHLRAPLKVQIGPWNHAYPHDGAPGPNYDFLGDAADWWRQVLAGAKTGACCSPKLLVFVRGSVPPGTGLSTAPGNFWFENWPVRGTRWERWYPQSGSRLAISTAAASTDRLKYVPSAGAGTLNWWGETTPDMRTADRDGLVYDSPPMTEDVRILGNPAVTLRVAADAPLADWVVRLEDRRPDGSVSFVTGAARNGAQRLSRVQPRALVAGERFTLRFPLHFTTWTFAKGDRIRLVVSNAQFPMFWPTPYAMTTVLATGDGASQLELPVAASSRLPAPVLRLPEPTEANPAGRPLASRELTPFHVSHDGQGHFVARADESTRYEINGAVVAVSHQLSYTIDDAHPASAGWRAESFETVKVRGRSIKVTSTIHVVSDQRYFQVRVSRAVYENGRLVRTRAWRETIPRDHQ